MHRRNIIYTGIQIAWRLILGNIFLLISNLILCILSFNLKFTLLTSLVYLIASITIFPSLVALVSYLKNDEVGDKVIAGAKYYFKAFSSAFKTGWINSLMYEIIIIFLLLDLVSANKLMKNGQFFMPMLTLLIVLSIIHAMWNILIQSYFYVDFKNSIIFATRLLIRKPLLSLLMIVLIFGDYVSLKNFPTICNFIYYPLNSICFMENYSKRFR